MNSGINRMAYLNGKLTKKLVENLGAGRHGDGGGLYLVVDPSGAKRWIVRVTVKGQKNRKGGPLRTDFGLGGADVVVDFTGEQLCVDARRRRRRLGHKTNQTHPTQCVGCVWR